MTQTALITGATTGFGRQFASLFAQDGYNVVLIARHEEALKQVQEAISERYGVRASYIAADLTEERAPGAIFNQVQAWGIEIDFLVNNAGYGDHGYFMYTDWEKERNMIQLDIVSLTQLTKLFLPAMLKRNRGRILNLASTVSVMPTPRMAVYAANKAYVLSFSEALAQEMKDLNSDVSVTALMPGASDTEFFDRADAEHTRVYQETPLTKPEKVALDGYEAMMNGRTRLVSGALNKIQAGMAQILPDSVVTAGMSKLMEEVR